MKIIAQQFILMLLFPLYFPSIITYLKWDFYFILLDFCNQYDWGSNFKNDEPDSKLMRKEDEEGIEIEQQPHSFVLKIISLIHGRSIIKISFVWMMILAFAYNFDMKFVLRHF